MARTGEGEGGGGGCKSKIGPWILIHYAIYAFGYHKFALYCWKVFSFLPIKSWFYRNKNHEQYLSDSIETNISMDLNASNALINLL